MQHIKELVEDLHQSKPDFHTLNKMFNDEIHRIYDVATGKYPKEFSINVLADIVGMTKYLHQIIFAICENRGVTSVDFQLAVENRMEGIPYTVHPRREERRHD